MTPQLTNEAFKAQAGVDIIHVPYKGTGETLRDVTGVPRLLEEFSKHGFTDEEIEQIAWSNWRRVLAKCWGEQ